MKKSLNNAISNISQSFYDAFIETNVKWKTRNGFKTVIVRRQLGKCCEWCADLAGTYTYDTAPPDVYARHDNCRCMVTVKTEKGYTDAWSKKEFQTQRQARIERAAEINSNQNQLDDLNALKRVARDKGQAYADTTDYWISNRKGNGAVEDADFVKVNGRRYNVKGTKVVLDYKPEEKATGELLADVFGGIVEMLPRVNWPKGVKTADFAVNGLRFDRKGPSGSSKNTIKKNILEAKGQANNVVLDLSKCGRALTDALSDCARAYNIEHLSFLDMLVVTKDGAVLKIFERT